MKIAGFTIPLTDANNGTTDKVVDMTALKNAWIERDTAGQDERWDTWVKGFGETLRVKSEWFPIFEEAMLAFWATPGFLRERIARETVVDMVWDRIRAKREIDMATYGAVKGLLAEFLADNCAAPNVHDESLMWRDAAKGPGAKLYLNPRTRAKWLAQADG